MHTDPESNRREAHHEEGARRLYAAAYTFLRSEPHANEGEDRIAACARRLGIASDGLDAAMGSILPLALGELRPLLVELDGHPEAHAVRERVWKELPREHRNLIALILLEGLTFEEIAEVVGRPLNSTCGECSKALIGLRIELEKALHPEGGGAAR